MHCIQKHLFLVLLFFFLDLQNLKFFDVSQNNLQTAMLGSQPQLPSLETLNLGRNAFTSLKAKDFSFLKDSPFLQVVNLSAVSLKTVCHLSRNGNRNNVLVAP